MFVESDVSRAAWRVHCNSDPGRVSPSQGSVDGASDCVAAEVAARFFVTKQNLAVKMNTMFIEMRKKYLVTLISDIRSASVPLCSDI